MIEIDLQTCCYECGKFDLEIREGEIIARDYMFERFAQVRCSKADVCKHVEQDEEHER